MLDRGIKWGKVVIPQNQNVFSLYLLVNIKKIFNNNFALYILNKISVIPNFWLIWVLSNLILEQDDSNGQLN